MISANEFDPKTTQLDPSSTCYAFEVTNIPVESTEPIPDSTCVGGLSSLIK